MFSEEEHLNAIKPLFPDLDDEFLWNVIFEKGMSPDGSYNPEKVINYLLGLKERENHDKSEQANDCSGQQHPYSLNESDSDEDYDEKDENIFSQFANLTFFNMGEYKQLK